VGASRRKAGSLGGLQLKMSPTGFFFFLVVFFFAAFFFVAPFFLPAFFAI
jgi:hypothetical protein